MLILAKFAAKILSILNSEVSPRQISAGFAFGVILGLVPAKGLLPILLLIFAFIININLAMMFVAAGIFKLISFGVDPLANHLGFILLTKVEALRGLWIWLYNAPILPFTRFNNTITMGSLAIGLLAFIPMYFLMRGFVVGYRTKWKDRILKIKIVQMARASTLYKYYLSYKGITED